MRILMRYRLSLVITPSSVVNQRLLKFHHSAIDFVSHYKYSLSIQSSFGIVSLLKLFHLIVGCLHMFEDRISIL
jgi:hypothetical protein